MATPNMNLTLPVVSETPGPAWANQINSDLATIDLHDHTFGNGSPIPSAALNINADLPFQNNSATGLRLTGFYNNAASLAGVVSSVYVAGGNLYFNDGSANQIRITVNGQIDVSSAGGITGLVSPANASFSPGTGTFSFYKTFTQLGTMLSGPISVTDGTASANAITIRPAAGASAWTLVLPAAPPVSSPALLGLSSGSPSNASPVYVNSTLTLTSSLLKVADLGITESQIAVDAVTTSKIKDLAVTTSKIADGAVTAAKMTPFNKDISNQVVDFLIPSNATWTNIPNLTVSLTPTSLRPVIVCLCAANENANVFSGRNALRLRVRVTGGTNADYAIGEVYGSLFSGSKVGVAVPPASFQLFFIPPSVASYSFQVQGYSPSDSPDTARIQSVYLAAYQL